MHQRAQTRIGARMHFTRARARQRPGGVIRRAFHSLTDEGGQRILLIGANIPRRVEAQCARARKQARRRSRARARRRAHLNGCGEMEASATYTVSSNRPDASAQYVHVYVLHERQLGPTPHPRAAPSSTNPRRAHDTGTRAPTHTHALTRARAHTRSHARKHCRRADAPVALIGDCHGRLARVGRAVGALRAFGARCIARRLAEHGRDRGAADNNPVLACRARARVCA
jgi:hypothetical protein